MSEQPDDDDVPARIEAGRELRRIGRCGVLVAGLCTVRAFRDLTPPPDVLIEVERGGYYGETEVQSRARWNLVYLGVGEE